MGSLPLQLKQEMGKLIYGNFLNDFPIVKNSKS